MSQTVTILWETLRPHVWHLDCPASRCGTMKPVGVPHKRAALLRCLSCGVHGIYPRNTIGPVITAALNADGQPLPETECAS